MSKVRITLVKSTIDRSLNQKRNVIALGIKKMNTPVEHEATPQILGIVNKVKHLVKVEQI
jgi:large subunit ribosomal protein L30